jgi:RimJ/RimL family protein N-acetyltransferase
MDRNEPFMEELGGVRDEAGTIHYLEMNLAHWAEYGFGLWMLRERETGTLIGRAVLRHLDIEGTDEVETGYGFLPQYWGRGLATEAARACVQIGRNRLGLRSIVAITLPSNTASQRVLVKAGLAYERDITHSGLPHALYRSVSSSA